MSTTRRSSEEDPERVEQPPTLTEGDEQLLDEAWAEVLGSRGKESSKESAMQKLTAGQKAARTRKHRQAGKKAALTRKRRAAGLKAAEARRRQAGG